MRVLMMVQEINEAHWLRGFTVEWIRALAAEVDHLHVLTLEQHAANLPPNVSVQSMGKELGKNRLREVRRFYQGLGEVIREVDVIFSHMTPRYTWLAAPYALAYRKPQILWYTHPKITSELRLATACATWVATADASSFPLKSPKVHAFGHGIDTTRYAPAKNIPESDPPIILAVGRVTPAKQHHILLEAAGILKSQGIKAQCVVVGAVAAGGDEDYQAQLIRRRGELGLTEAEFCLKGAVASADLIAFTHTVTAITNLSPQGYFDKAALEGMLMGKPLITANPAFDPLLGEHGSILKIPRYDDPQALARAIQTLIQLAPATRHQMGLDLRARTAQAHGLPQLMQHLAVLMASR